MADGTSLPRHFGDSVSRVDGVAKVTGTARYAGDQPTTKPAYGVLHTSTIAKGRIRAIHEEEARRVRGVLEIFTYRNIGHINPGKTFDQKGYMGTSIAPMQPEIHHDGQIVALVVAETFEAAREGAPREKFVDIEAMIRARE